MNRSYYWGICNKCDGQARVYDGARHHSTFHDCVECKGRGRIQYSIIGGITISYNPSNQEHNPLADDVYFLSMVNDLAQGVTSGLLAMSGSLPSDHPCLVLLDEIRRRRSVLADERYNNSLIDKNIRERISLFNKEALDAMKNELKQVKVHRRRRKADIAREARIH